MFFECILYSLVIYVCLFNFSNIKIKNVSLMMLMIWGRRILTYCVRLCCCYWSWCLCMKKLYVKDFTKNGVLFWFSFLINYFNNWGSLYDFMVLFYINEILWKGWTNLLKITPEQQHNETGTVFLHEVYCSC